MKSTSIPLLIFFTLAFSCTTSSYGKSPLIMLDPIGHADFTGRTMLKGYERGVMLTFAHNLQTVLQTDHHLETIISRKAGEAIAPLEIASFANRLQVGLVVNLQGFLTQKAKPTINIYHLCFNKFTEFNQPSLEPGTFIPVERAHLGNIRRTATLASAIKTSLLQFENIKLLDVSSPVALPIKSLIGITSPAISLEIGSANEKFLSEIIKPIAQAIANCYKK